MPLAILSKGGAFAFFRRKGKDHRSDGPEDYIAAGDLLSESATFDAVHTIPAPAPAPASWALPAPREGRRSWLSTLKRRETLTMAQALSLPNEDWSGPTRRRKYTAASSSTRNRKTKTSADHEVGSLRCAPRQAFVTRM